MMNGARLPQILLPMHYDLNYDKIDLVHFTFDGTVTTECRGVKTIEKTILKLHALELQLLKATLTVQSSNSVLTASQLRHNLKEQTCELIFDEANVLKEGDHYVLKIDFRGILNNQMRGLYRSTYVSLDGSEVVMATTQFEPTDARRAFPCWDEPALKATFALTVTIPVHLQCISNTPMASTRTTLNDRRLSKTITFQTTPKMSTYLLALVVGQFDGISRTSRQIVTTVWTVPGKAEQGEFCLDTAVRCLDLYQELFHVPYPLVKSDLVAIPDFAAGAMENWGCVTYREAKILVKPPATSESMKRSIARTVCHELAHQWFGNLVTPEFWTQLWLKEGMARFMEFVACDKIFPEWSMWTEFVQSVYGLALALDSMKSSHPVEVEVNHPDEINEIFDAISYAKGASIVRMIASYIGMEKFFDGMRLYLSRHAYGNACTNDVWGALEEVSGLPVVDIMVPWTLKVGFPILLLEDGGISVERFLADGSVPSSDNTVWPIPVTAIVEGLDGIQGPWVISGPMGDESEALRSQMVEWYDAGKWFKLNARQTGFFRVCYSADQWSRLSAVMDPNGPLSLDDRLGLVSDSFAAGKSGYISIVRPLQLIANFGSHEFAEYSVWEELSENLSGIMDLFGSESFYPAFQSFVRGIYAPHAAALGWDSSPDESARSGTLRATVISMMGKAGDSEVLSACFRYFMLYKSGSTTIPGDLQGAIFRCALRHDEATVYAGLKELYETSTFPEEQRNCLSVLGCVKDPKLHADMLLYVFFSGNVRLQDISFALASLSGTSDSGGLAAWTFFKDCFDRLHSMLGAGPMWAPCVALCCRGLTNPEGVQDVERFFAQPSHPVGSATRRLQQALEFVRVKIDRLERDKESVARFLSPFSA